MNLFVQRHNALHEACGGGVDLRRYGRDRLRRDAIENRPHAGELAVHPRRRSPDRSELFPFVAKLVVEDAILDLVEFRDIDLYDSGNRVDDALDDRLEQ